MKSGAGKRVSTLELTGRGIALMLAVGCFAAIAWSLREAPETPSRPQSLVGASQADLVRPAPAPAAREACLAQKEAEIAALRAQGENAERRMRIRQIEARPCD